MQVQTQKHAKTNNVLLVKSSNVIFIPSANQANFKLKNQYPEAENMLEYQ